MSHLHRWITPLALAVVLVGCAGTPSVSTNATTEPSTEVPPTSAPMTQLTTEPTTATVPEATAETSPTRTPASTLSPQATNAVEQSDAELKASVQETVDLWNRAYTEANHDILIKAIDPKAATLRRILGDQLDTIIQSQGTFRQDGKVVDTERRANGYVLAHIDAHGRIYTFTFRNVNGKWLLSEPQRAELGKKQMLKTEHFQLEYYAWDGDVAPEISKMLEDAHTFVVGKLGKGPEQLIRVQLNATAQLARSNGLVLAFYQTGTTRRVRGVNITVNSPNSFQGGRYDRAAGWQQQMAETLNHEYVHLVHDCCFANLFLQATWMTEGLAVYLTEGGYTNGYMSYVQRAVQNDAIIPIWAPSPEPGQVPKSLQAFDELNESETLTAYGLSATLVEYIVDNYGGLDSFWKLATDYEKNHDVKVSVQNALGISFEELETAWRNDLIKRYGG